MKRVSKAEFFDNTNVKMNCSLLGAKMIGLYDKIIPADELFIYAWKYQNRFFRSHICGDWEIEEIAKALHTDFYRFFTIKCK